MPLRFQQWHERLPDHPGRTGDQDSLWLHGSVARGQFQVRLRALLSPGKHRREFSSHKTTRDYPAE